MNQDFQKGYRAGYEAAANGSFPSFAALDWVSMKDQKPEASGLYPVLCELPSSGRKRYIIQTGALWTGKAWSGEAGQWETLYWAKPIEFGLPEEFRDTEFTLLPMYSLCGTA